MAFKDFTLHHHIARPISLNSYPPIAGVIQNISIVFSIVTIGVLAWLMYNAYTTLKGASLGLLLTVLLPLKVGIILFGFFIYYKSTFKRDLKELKRKHALKYEHSFRHN
jgi:hypothetical protein